MGTVVPEDYVYDTSMRSTIVTRCDRTRPGCAARLGRAIPDPTPKGVPRARSLLPICITGSEGLIGSGLTAALAARGRGFRRFDVRLPVGHPGRGTVEAPNTVASRVTGAAGVVHLAAISRVVEAARAPERCWAIQVGGTVHVLEAAADAGAWVLLASSREVYGQPSSLPVTEDAPRRPIGVYGRAKVEAERLVDAVTGRPTAIVRLSNVYGRTDDHDDRVAPAFARAAAAGAALRIQGPQCAFDFTHLDDVIRGLLAVIDTLDAGRALPTLHFATGRATTLSTLAEAACVAGDSRAHIDVEPPRPGAVTRFAGDPSRAWREIGWSPRIDVATGMARLVGDFAAERSL